MINNNFIKNNIIQKNINTITIASFYYFIKLPDYKELKNPFLYFLKSKNIKGTLLLSLEGINGTVAGSTESIIELEKYLYKDIRFKKIIIKKSFYEKIPFFRTKVKLKKEIITMGIKDINPRNISGIYVSPQDWNALIIDPNVIVIDNRNDYEISIGTFKNAINPQIQTFREFPNYLNRKLNNIKNKKIAMFCTGGIRCEKSTSYLKQQGFKSVYHLQGGILRYLEEIDKNKSFWKGECFVFDSRVSVKYNLKKGKYNQCYACRIPINKEDQNSKFYIKGVSCHNCYNKKTEYQINRYIQREKQIFLNKQYKNF